MPSSCASRPFLAALWSILFIAAADTAEVARFPTYDVGGRLLLPDNYETWIFVGSNLGLGYLPDAVAMTAVESQRAEDRAFHNIYIDPAAYAAFVQTGAFPDPTVFVMENYHAEARDPGGVLNEGEFNGELVRVEAAVKDSRRPTRPDSLDIWAYYAFQVDASGRPGGAARAFPDAACNTCHEVHAGHDNVWVQFYPKLRRRLQQ